MQINSNTSFQNIGTNPGSRPEVNRERQNNAATQALTKKAIEPNGQLQTVIDQNDRAKLLAKTAYAGASARGSIVDIRV